MNRLTLATCAAAVLSLALPVAAQSPPRGDFQSFGTGCPGTGGHVQIVLPAEARDAMGSTHSNLPQGIAGIRYQQIFRMEQSGTSGQLLIGLALRQDDVIVPPDEWTPSRQYLEVNLVRTDTRPEEMSNDFEENLGGSHPQTVFEGWVNFPLLSGTNQDPNRFDFYLPFDQPFGLLLDERALLIEVRNRSEASDTALVFDAHETADTSRLYGQDVAGDWPKLELGVGLVVAFRTDDSAAGTPFIGNTGRPTIGQSFRVDLHDGCKRSFGALIIGASNEEWGPFKLPLQLIVPQCQLLVSADLLEAREIDVQGRSYVQFEVPDDTGLIGAHFFTQWLALDLPANALGICMSDAAKVTIGL